MPKKTPKPYQHQLASFDEWEEIGVLEYGMMDYNNLPVPSPRAANTPHVPPAEPMDVAEAPIVTAVTAEPVVPSPTPPKPRPLMSLTVKDRLGVMDTRRRDRVAQGRVTRPVHRFPPKSFDRRRLGRNPSPAAPTTNPTINRPTHHGLPINHEKSGRMTDVYRQFFAGGSTIPLCYNCKAAGHVAKHCRRPKAEQGRCVRCGLATSASAICDRCRFPDGKPRPHVPLRWEKPGRY